MRKYLRGDQAWFEAHDTKKYFLNYQYFDYEGNPYQKFRLKTIFRSIKKVIAELKDKQISIIDVGCATGALLKKVKETHPLSQVAGIDLVLSNIEVAAKEVDGIFLQKDIRNYMLEPKVDSNIQIFSDILYYLDDKEQIDVINNMAKSLSANGFIVISSRVSPTDDQNYNSIDDLQRMLVDCGLKPYISQFWLTQPYSFVSRIGSYIERRLIKKTGKSLDKLKESNFTYFCSLVFLKSCVRFLLLISAKLTKLTLNQRWLRKYATNFVIVARKGL